MPVVAPAAPTPRRLQYIHLFIFILRLVLWQSRLSYLCRFAKCSFHGGADLIIKSCLILLEQIKLISSVSCDHDIYCTTHI